MFLYLDFVVVFVFRKKTTNFVVSLYQLGVDPVQVGCFVLRPELEIVYFTPVISVTRVMSDGQDIHYPDPNLCNNGPKSDTPTPYL